MVATDESVKGDSENVVAPLDELLVASFLAHRVVRLAVSFVVMVHQIPINENIG